MIYFSINYGIQRELCITTMTNHLCTLVIIAEKGYKAAAILAALFCEAILRHSGALS